MKKLLVLTTNEEKLSEYTKLLCPEIEVISRPTETIEPQTMDQSAIAQYKAEQAFLENNQPLCSDDFAMYINKYNSFPGPLTKYILKSIGYQGLFKLIDEGEPAFYQCVIAYKDSSVQKIFTGRLDGILTKKFPQSYNKKMPLNSIFIPDGYSVPFAEASQYKNFVTHRSKAISKLKSFLTDASNNLQ